MKEIPASVPIVSVIIPLYNGGKFIGATLSSVLEQTYTLFEIIVIDDGSSDDGPSIVAGVSRDHPGMVRMITHSDHANHGIAASRNLGIRNAKGSLIAFIDQDDLWVPQKLEKQVNALEKFPDASLVYARTAFIDDEGQAQKFNGRYSTYGQGISGKSQNVFGKLIDEDFIPNLTVLVRKSCLERVNYLEEGPHYEYEDWLLLSKLAYFFDFLFIPEVLASWRVHENNFSAKIFYSGQFSRAEEHCTVALFSYLLKDSAANEPAVRRYLRGRIWRLFLRAKSWGAGPQLLEEHTSNLQRAFPEHYRTVQRAWWCSRILPQFLASGLRRLRRRFVGV